MNLLARLKSMFRPTPSKDPQGALVEMSKHSADAYCESYYGMTLQEIKDKFAKARVGPTPTTLVINGHTHTIKPDFDLRAAVRARRAELKPTLWRKILKFLRALPIRK